jgi:hypothetical protein
MRPMLLNAYRQTSYEAAGVHVRIGKRSKAADQLLRAHGARSATFITAYNPLSRVMPPEWNHRMQARLHHVLRRRPVLCGHGILRRWSEAHLLVFGDPRPIRRLARLYRQYGIVIVRRLQAARLVIIF